MRTSVTFFPSQKISTSKKNTKWYKDCVDAGEALAIYRADGETELHHKMQVWEDLDNDIIDEREIEQVFNPMQLEDVVFPAAIKNYPLSVPKIDLLQGEETKRKFDWKVMAKNENSFSARTDAIREAIMEIAMQEIENESFNEEEAQKRIQETSKYFQYDYKDLNELYGTRILEYLWREQDLKRKFFSGIREALVKRREIYRIDDIGGEPSMVKCDAKTIYPMRKGDSHKVEDSDIIIEVTYDPVGRIIDEFHDYLKPSEIVQLEEGTNKITGSSNGVLNHQNAYPTLLAEGFTGDGTGNMFDSPVLGAYNLPFDYEGNVRVTRARWRGMRKIGKLTYFDEETGNEMERLVSENYKVNKDRGEEVKWIWVNEAYEATRLAEDIYVKMQPREVQMRHFDNPSKCFLGYVGTDYGMSLMERMEPYQYLYNVYMRRLELAIAKYKGPIYELDLSKKPDEWSEQMWMYYGEVLGWAVIDSFNEGKKGAATGKIAGNMNSQSKVLDANASNYIQQLLLMLQHIEKQMGQIAGVTEQRQGQIDNRETVGGIERAVTQSSHITEKWFFIHDETKKRAMLALLDTAKQLWKNKKSKKISFVMDDMSRIAIDVNGEDFASSEYDIFITDSSDDLKIRQTIEQLSHAYVQNGGSLTLPIKVLRSDSITQMAKIIEDEESRMKQREEEMDQKRLQAEQQSQQAQLQDKQADRDLEYYKIDKDSDTKLLIAGVQNTGQDGMEDEKLELDREKERNDVEAKEKELSLKERQLEENIRHNKKGETIDVKKLKKNKTN